MTDDDDSSSLSDDMTDETDLRGCSSARLGCRNEGNFLRYVKIIIIIFSRYLRTAVPKLQVTGEISDGLRTLGRKNPSLDLNCRTFSKTLFFGLRGTQKVRTGNFYNFNFFEFLHENNTYS